MEPPIIEATMDGGVAFYKRRDDPGMVPCTDAQLQDRDFVLGLVAHCGLALSLAAPHLKEDADVVLAAVRQSGWALEFASAALRGDRELVLLAVRDAGWALQYACGEAVKGDREIILLAVRLNGALLQHASDALRADPEVVAEAARQKGPAALQYAIGEEVKADPGVMAAVASFGGGDGEGGLLAGLPPAGALVMDEDW
jgi:hypothetical protein